MGGCELASRSQVTSRSSSATAGTRTGPAPARRRRPPRASERIFVHHVAAQLVVVRVLDRLVHVVPDHLLHRVVLDVDRAPRPSAR